MSRRVVIQGSKSGLLSGLAEEVAREMRAEGAQVSFDAKAGRFVYEGYDDHYRRETEDAEARYGEKLQKLREEQVLASSKKIGYALDKRRVEENGNVRLLLRRRVYG